ncbi:SERTA domain-containing protein 2-like [Dunckerocampus dactyliophorus]|uniref:SERTA domain-containing protein 2-like n=1 Tax=Dunckerocampus dactyliophorus TaxID=161453 RepID=UPI0024071008|nr:SERTA domain-containing protein 2-like [Dunckerocampus dactyliophorus]
MWANGVKRKLEDGEDEVASEEAACGASQASWTLWRQAVLNMSLMKLYRPQRGVDVGLQRRVLINNIIRRIHNDLQQEGGASSLRFSTTPPTAFQPPASSLEVLSSLSALDSCLTPASLLEDEVPVFFALPAPSPAHLYHVHAPSRSPSSRDSFSSALEDIGELYQSSSSPPARLLFDALMKEEGRGLQEAELRTEKAPPLALDATNSSPLPASPFLTDLVLDDVLFTDIDTSMYDFRQCPPPSATKRADSLVRSLSGYGAAGAGTQSPMLKMDVTELEHIMEVLVES